MPGNDYYRTSLCGEAEISQPDFTWRRLIELVQHFLLDRSRSQGSVGIATAKESISHDEI
jgi:hypothetical protein